MKVVSLSGSLREGVGKKDAKEARKNGLIPCVIYGGEKQIHCTVQAVEFDKLLFTPYVNLIDIEVGGQTYRAMIQDVQYHPVSDNCLHVDFLQIFGDKPVKIAVPVKVTGTSPGVMKGGKLHKKMRKIQIQALENFLPDAVEVDITPLEIGMAVRVEDLKMEGVSFLDAERAVVVMIKAARGTADDDVEGDVDDDGEEASASEE